MMLRTHLAIIIFVVLMFLPHIAMSKILFVALALFATLLPDIDNDTSTIGKYKIFRPIQMLFKHRGFLHSLTFCFLISLLLAFFIPTLALAFFLGYAFHLFADSFTQEGITPFWPWKKISKWHLRTGGSAETTLFMFFVLFDIILFLLIVM